MVRQRRVAARAMHCRAVRLVEEPALPQVLEDPPARLHVVVGVGDVGMLEVDPEPDPFGQLVPVNNVGKHRLLAKPVELGDPVRLNVLLPLRPDLLLDLHLDGKPMSVPPRPP